MKSAPAALTQAFGSKLLLNAPLAPYTYIKIGGPAEYLLNVTTVSDLVLGLKSAKQDQIPVTILGSASNVCISDAGLSGLVIINRAQSLTRLPHHQLQAASGTLISQLVNYANDQGLGGLAEFLGLPGTVGGAVINNSHHLKYLIGDLISGVETLSPAGELTQFNRSQCEFAYDQSVFQKNQHIILNVVFELHPEDPVSLRQTAKAALLRRRQTQPLSLPSSGCMFKNPPSPQPSAGYMIDQLGLKNYRIGGAMVSPVHANFIVNTGEAKAADIVALSNLIRQKVQEAYKIKLDREIFFLGNHPHLVV